MAKQENFVEKDLQQMDAALNKSEHYLEQNYKKLIIAVGVIVALAVAGFGLYHGVLIPRDNEAANALFKGQNYFAADSFEVALKGDGVGYLGFEAIADKYSFTKTANLANIYAGICYYKMGNAEKALEYLRECSADEEMIAPALIGRIGDCYADMGNAKEAIGYFEKAAAKADNNALSPLYLKKAGLAYMELGDNASAQKCFAKIKESYANSQEASEADKYIEYIQLKK